MGNQGQASEEHRLMAEMIAAGAVGTWSARFTRARTDTRPSLLGESHDRRRRRTCPAAWIGTSG